MFVIRYKEEKENTAKLQKEKSELELQSLKSQLHPHFLFNTLNNIYSLSVSNSDKTSRSISQLSDILDYILHKGQQKWVSIAEELAVIDDYIALESLRYRDERLKVNKKIILHSSNLIPPLLYLTLVENAFKHGAGKNAGHTEIHIEAETDQKQSVFRITNTYNSTQPNNEKGIGLQNVKSNCNITTVKIFPTRSHGKTIFLRLKSSPLPPMINCLIVDDEPLAADLLENHISKINHLKLAGKAENAMDAYAILQNQAIDLMFLDIHMPDLNGIDFLKSLSRKPKTIFTTAYRDFAVEGFELEAVDYLLKPITFERFFKAVERVLRNTTHPSESFIIIRTEGMQRKVSLAEIVYIESQGNDIKLTLSGGEHFISKSKIADLESALSSKGFIRIHRSFIINTQYVTAFTSHEIHLGIHHIPVGRSYKQEAETFTSAISKNRVL